MKGLMSYLMTGVKIGTSPMWEDSVAPPGQTKERLVSATSVWFWKLARVDAYAHVGRTFDHF